MDLYFTWDVKYTFSGKWSLPIPCAQWSEAEFPNGVSSEMTEVSLGSQLIFLWRYFLLCRCHPVCNGMYTRTWNGITLCLHLTLFSSHINNYFRCLAYSSLNSYVFIYKVFVCHLTNGVSVILCFFSLPFKFFIVYVVFVLNKNIWWNSR